MFLQEPVLYVASAALRCLVLFAELRKPDSNREASKKALNIRKKSLSIWVVPLSKQTLMSLSFVCDSGVEVDIAIRDVGGLYLGLWVDEKFKFLCDNGDGGHEIKIATRDLGGLGTLIGELGCFGEDRCFHQFWGCWGVIAHAEWDMIKFQVLLDGWSYFWLVETGDQQALYELVILPLRKPEFFSHEKLLGPQKGVLLYGPPGTGKTILAKAIIREFGAVFINMRISNLMSKWFSDAQKLGSCTQDVVGSVLLIGLFLSASTREKRSSFGLSLVSKSSELGCIDIVHSSCSAEYGTEGSLANISTQEGSLTEMDKEVSDNSMDPTLANVNGRLENLATCTEPTIVYSSAREVAATHHLGKFLGIHRDTNDGLVAEHIRSQIDTK
ncbi:hypothetical protein POTOM_041561 [Populus tomentosa]|uniref:ATPase AAA-type core domain-containing protein n=1 Tax=Populus tomentosa TaxID=118781 RepID=A0A8X7YQ17_POPTO|nr:hypothetical protein POTOM_041561 [Populus tomentosa]